MTFMRSAILEGGPGFLGPIGYIGSMRASQPTMYGDTQPESSIYYIIFYKYTSKTASFSRNHNNTLFLLLIFCKTHGS